MGVGTMKIVDRKTFLKMPVGTVYREYKPYIFGPIRIKDTSLESDFFYIEIGEPDVPDHSDFADACQKMEDGENVRMDLGVVARDGLFDENQLYMVFSDDDIYDIVAKLKEGLYGHKGTH